ncbi:MAG: hypothetical protein TYPL_0490 [Candidatus Tyloplasma litorale]|nr:MAG: hypothetical protein TYPL_0490 [Mycoplasmatales bacterium]
MEAKDWKINELVSGKDTIFTIPSYQRNYKWRFKTAEKDKSQKNNEVGALMSDINEFIKDHSRKNYFLGTIVIKSIPQLSRNFVLIDGQQRITTFLLMISAMRECFDTNDPFRREELEKILETEEDKFKLNRINDQNIIKKILDGKHNSITKEEEKSIYFVNFVKIFNFFKKMDKSKIKEFYDFGIRKIDLAVVRLDSDEDEFLVFESINSKGQSLSSGDLIKNYVMMQFIHEHNLEQKFQDEIVSKLSNEELEDFYRQLIAIRTGKLPSKKTKSLYYSFKNEFDRDWIKNNKEELILILKHNLAIWKYIHKVDFGYETLPIIHNILNFYTILYALVEKNSIWSEEENELININEKNIRIGFIRLSEILIRRTLGGRGRVESNRTFAKLGSDYYKDENAVFDEYIYLRLEHDVTKVRTPSWEEVEELIYKMDVYSSKSMIKWILIAIEEKNSKKKIFNTDEFTIEHIYPQNPDDSWDYLSIEDKYEMGNMLNTLGNISITNHNSALGNKIFSKKKEILEDRSYLKINKMIYEVDKWDSKAIKERANKLLNYIKEIWS